MNIKLKLDLLIGTFAVCALVSMVLGTFGTFLLTALWVNLIPGSVILFELVKENQVAGGEKND